MEIVGLIDFVGVGLREGLKEVVGEAEAGPEEVVEVADGDTEAFTTTSGDADGVALATPVEFAVLVSFDAPPVLLLPLPPCN